MLFKALPKTKRLNKQEVTISKGFLILPVRHFKCKNVKVCKNISKCFMIFYIKNSITDDSTLVVKFYNFIFRNKNIYILGLTLIQYLCSYLKNALVFIK